jgi:hypothetical protein
VVVLARVSSHKELFEMLDSVLHVVFFLSFEPSGLPRPRGLLAVVVIDILCRDNKAEGLYALFRTSGDPSTSHSQPYLLTVVNLLHDIIWSSSRTSTFPATPLGRDISCFIIISTR